MIHRLWIAVGNEADAYATLIGDRHAEPWRTLYSLRNKLAHVRLPDVDEDEGLAHDNAASDTAARHSQTPPA